MTPHISDRPVEETPAIAFIGVSREFCRHDQRSITGQGTQGLAEIEQMEKDKKETHSRAPDVRRVRREKEGRGSPHRTLPFGAGARVESEESDLVMREKKVWYQLPLAYRAPRKLQESERVLRGGCRDVGSETKDGVSNDD